MNRLDGKVISGAARGIRAETARLMLEAGARVAIGDVLDEKGRETARVLGGDAVYLHAPAARKGSRRPSRRKAACPTWRSTGTAMREPPRRGGT